MAYPFTPKLNFPLEKYESPPILRSGYLLASPRKAGRRVKSSEAIKLNGWKFKRKTTIKKVFWGIHLGEDIIRPAGTKVKSIGRGKVVYSALHRGSKKKGNWGNIVIIAHKNSKTKKAFFSLYAHLQKPKVRKNQKVEFGEAIGFIGKKNTSQNGWWPEHLHFGIYVGSWNGKVLPGYWKKGQSRTKVSYWKEPGVFVKNYKA